MRIGTVLKKIRMIYSINAKELAPQLDISPSYLSEIEHNKKIPSLELLERYSEIFDIKTSSIILMAEDYQKNTEKNKSEKFIQKRMLNLLTKFSSSEEKNDA
ncbi:helix-turn-helix domain-containing protein [Enterococcus sp. CSURQ0835]|uniref:helix-turn-helix domain-containing protein n=1 Tax=Enterococcus sp. CSURQ0835 TaxID=2681394 RepID=UPI00135ABFA5|nr:helix-turn-helix transcriptional regulator [Enterococcus sp. CSURQ0835]